MCGHQRTTRILRDPMNQRASDMPALAPLSVVAKVTGLAVPTVYRAVKRGEIPLAPIGGRKRVRVRDLETLIARLRPSTAVGRESHGEFTKRIGAKVDLLSPQRANAGNSMKGLAVTTLTPGASFAPSGSDDPTELSTLLQRAGQRLLDARTSGEVLEAMRLADLALHYAKVTGAANQTHADWRRIILRAEIRLVDEIDLGQANHELLQSVDTLKRGPVAQTSTSINYADLGITSQGVSEWREISDAGEAAVEPVINNALDEGRVPTKTGIRSYVHGRFGSGQVDWWTPTRYLEAARDVLGAIDLDPASSAGAQANVRATQYLTKETNGIARQSG